VRTTFRLHPVIDGRCGCGNSDCKIAGKHPPTGWPETPPGPELVPTETQGVGIVTGAVSGIFVVDLDVKNGVDGVANFAALGEVPPTYTVATPTGGFHLYFRHPGFRVRNSAPNSNPIALGVDIRGDGGYVVAPGSPHRNGGRYAVAADLPIAEAPAWLLAWPGLRVTEATLAAPVAEIEERFGRIPREWRVERARKWLESQPPAVQGDGGDGRTWAMLVRAVHDNCLTDADMIADAFVDWNARCEPPWTGSQWGHKVQDVLHSSIVPWSETLAVQYRLEQAAPPAPEPTSLAAKLAAIVSGQNGAIVKPIWKVGGLDADQEPIEFWIDGLIARGDVVMLVAHGNSLKTWLALSFGHAIASGRPWLGKFAAKRGRVAILDYESGEYEIVRRLKLLGVKDAQVEDRLLRSSYSGANLSNPETWLALEEAGLDVIIVDSFNAASDATLDENDARSAMMLKYAGCFAEHTGCIVIVIHHARKGSGGDQREIVRGSTALYAACDRVFKFDEPEKKEGGLVLSTMKSVKDGAGRPPANVRVELSDQGLRWVEISPEEAKAEDNEDSIRRAIIDTLRKKPSGSGGEELIDSLEGAKDVRRRVFARLLLADIVHKHTIGKRVFYTLNEGIEI
jgi:hypothetical protein